MYSIMQNKAFSSQARQIICAAPHYLMGEQPPPTVLTQSMENHTT